MTAITPTGFNSFNPAAYKSYTSTGVVRTEAVYNQVSDIVIHTLEGDRVTLSSSTYNAGGYEAYDSLSAANGRVAYQYGEATYFRSRQQMDIAVTGDLNEKELKEIDRILGTLDDMMKDLTVGNLEGALKKSTRFAGIDAIASFSADLNVSIIYATSRFDTERASTFVPGAEGGENDATRRILQSADSISQALKNKTTLLEYLVPGIENSFSEWFGPPAFTSIDPSKGAKWAHHFARRLLDGLKPGIPHEWQKIDRGHLEQDNTAGVYSP